MVSYTNNTPQANQTIAQTQPLILNNFAFLANSIGEEHNFNAAGNGTDTYHLQASMPNQALSPALPASTNGMYFVSSARPYFWDGTTNYNLFTSFYASGNNTVANGASFQIIAAGDYMGYVNVIRTTNAAYQFLQFRVVAGVLTTNRMASGGSSNINVVLDGGNNIMIENTFSGGAQNFRWQAFYNAAP
jgi:hypothetical protein